MSAQRWEVVGGGKEGILVRLGRDLKSPEAPSRLARGARLVEVEREGERIHYRKLEGDGPLYGWVSLKVKGKDLLAPDTSPGPEVVPKPDSMVVWVYFQGTRGDAQPYIALGLGLKRAGMDVKLIGPSTYADFATKLGVEYAGFNDGTVQDQLQSSQTTLLMLLVMDPKKPKVLVHSHGGGAIGYACWKRYATIPILANMGTEPFREREERQQMHQLFSIFDVITTKQFLKISPTAELTLDEFMERQQCPGQLMATSPYITMLWGPEQLQKAQHYNYTGYWTLDEKDMGDSSLFGDTMKLVKDFLGKGEPPVYMGWGSMITERFHMILVAVGSLMKAKQRGIITAGWADLNIDYLKEAVRFMTEAANSPEDAQILIHGDLRVPAKDLVEAATKIVGSIEALSGLVEYADNNILFIKSAQHEWLFPRCCCTVHHGGAGTTAVSLRAGVPLVVTPIMMDQFDCARWIPIVGVGASTGFFGSISADELGEKLQEVLSSDDIKARAKEMGKVVKKEHGVASAVAHIKDILELQVMTGEAQQRWKVEKAEEKKGGAKKKLHGLENFNLREFIDNIRTTVGAGHMTGDSSGPDVDQLEKLLQEAMA